jgi:argininosuccinate lyase
MGNRGDHMGVCREHQRYEVEERESLSKLAEVMREDDVADAMAWAARLKTGGTLRDQSRAIIIHHVGRLLEAEARALRKNATERDACLTLEVRRLKSTISMLREETRNLRRYRTDCQRTA